MGDRRAALWSLAGMALLLAAPLAFEAAGQSFYLRVLTRILIFGLAASSLNLILGYGGLVSLGHAAFTGSASYVVGILAWHDAQDLPLIIGPVTLDGSTQALVAWPAAIAVAAVLALVVGAISLRTSGLYFIMITLAFAQMVFYFAVSLDQYGGDDGLRIRARSSLPGVDLGSRVGFYYLVLGALLLGLGFIHLLVRSRFGLVIRGARQNPVRMRAVGIGPFPYQLACFTISGALAGCAGVLLANLDGFVSPSDLSITRSNELVAMTLIGGAGTVWGPVLGAAFYIALQLGLGNLTTHWPIVFGPALILVVLFARGGLAGLLGVRRG